MSNKYEECRTCVFRDCQEKDICDTCEDADEYVPDDNASRDDDGIEDLRHMTFIPRHQEIVSDPEEGLDFLINHKLCA